MKDTLILKDGTIIELESAASLSTMVCIFPNWEEAVLVLKKLASENLAVAKVKNGEGLVVGNYTDLVLLPGAWKIDSSGVRITLSVREKTDEERRLDALEDGQEVQDGAITELAGIVAGGET